VGYPVTPLHGCFSIWLIGKSQVLHQIFCGHIRNRDGLWIDALRNDQEHLGVAHNLGTCMGLVRF
jgi:hypothetical protein